MSYTNESTGMLDGEKKTERIVTRVTKDTADALDQYAWERNISISRAARELIEKGLKEE